MIAKRLPLLFLTSILCLTGCSAPRGTTSTSAEAAESGEATVPQESSHEVQPRVADPIAPAAAESPVAANDTNSSPAGGSRAGDSSGEIKELDGVWHDEFHKVDVMVQGGVVAISKMASQSKSPINWGFKPGLVVARLDTVTKVGPKSKNFGGVLRTRGTGGNPTPADPGWHYHEADPAGFVEMITQNVGAQPVPRLHVSGLYLLRAADMKSPLDSRD